MGKEEEGKKIPAGSMSVHDTGDDGGKGNGDDGAKLSKIKVGDREYDDPGKLAEDHLNLSKKFGEQGNELGSLRAQNQAMADQLAQMQERLTAVDSGGGDEVQALQAELEALEAAVAEGDITMAEAIRKSSTISAQIATKEAVAEANRTFQQTLQERDARETQRQFLKNNPDFEQLRNNGTLQQIRAENPMHDDFSAYYAYQAMNAYEKGKAEQAALAAGGKETDTVLTGGGEGIRHTVKPSKPLSESEHKASMMEALGKMSGG